MFHKIYRNSLYLKHHLTRKIYYTHLMYIIYPIMITKQNNILGVDKMPNIAIYSRKSVFTGKGESIENQISLCKNYCNSYISNREDIKYKLYEDEGFSGKNTNRPEFQKMINDIKQRKIDILICYRLDRISRNVADFSTTLELLQKYNVNFISIKERFDTSTPLGRAMIYIASVFAQLERETIAERVRDNMLQLAKSGRWLGGNIPYGFNTEKKIYLTDDFKEKSLSILTPNEQELKIVKLIYSYYEQNHSIRETARMLNINSIAGKLGGHIDITTIRRMLRNPLYVISNNDSHEYLMRKGINVFGKPNGNGYITYNKSKHTLSSSNNNKCIAAISNHKGIISSDVWLKIQNQLDKNKLKASRIGTGKNHSLLAGILKCKKCGSNMIIKFSGKNSNNNPYEYYVCSRKQNKYKNKCTTKNIRVDILDKKILDTLNGYNKEILLSTLKKTLIKFNESFPKEHIANIKSKIQENESSISSLINKLCTSPSQSVSDRLMNEINILDKNIQDLNKQLVYLSSKTNSVPYTTTDINDLLNSLINLGSGISHIEDISQQRFLIQSIIKSAVWDSDKNNIEIILY